MKILIATGIYPPEIGGPAQYAFNLNNEFKNFGHETFVVSYGKEMKFPPIIRHFFYFLKIISKIYQADVVLILDTFSSALPTILASKIFGKKTVLRTGGDFLWEKYIERTGDMVLLRDFYGTRMNKLNFQEKIVFRLIKWILNSCDSIVFSTRWQLNIFISAYNLDSKKLFIVENFYGEKEIYVDENREAKKVFVAGTRKLKWKNRKVLRRAFEIAKKKKPEIELDLSNTDYSGFIDKIKASYAVILASLGDISPNMILDAIRLGKPFILTRENGLNDRIGNLGLFIDPKNESDIATKIEMISDENIYKKLKENINNFDFVHSWSDICSEFINIFQKI